MATKKTEEPKDTVEETVQLEPARLAYAAELKPFGYQTPEEIEQEKADREIIRQRLLAPFPMSVVDTRPGAFGRGGAKPLFYIDARDVSKRLHDVLGLGTFSIVTNSLNSNFDRKEENKKNKETGQFEVKTLEGLLVSCVCEIHVHHPLFSTVASNVGEKGLDEQGYNKVTSAWSQAFKRAAAMGLGIGEYLYFMDFPFTPYNDGKFQFDNAELGTKITEALQNVGFKFTCEVTGQIVPWNVAALAVHRYGRVLSVDAVKNLFPAPTK